MNQLFYLFAAFTLVSGIMVIESRNPIHSILFLILVFFNASGLLLLLGLDFFALLFLVVYVGAIAVLFLFVVMMLHVKHTEINEKRVRYLPVGILVAFLFAIELLLVVDAEYLPFTVSPALEQSDFTLSTLVEFNQLIDPFTNIKAIGMQIYTYYFSYMLIASLVLLVAMLGAIFLTMEKQVYTKRQKVVRQNTREFAATVARF